MKKVIAGLFVLLLCGGLMLAGLATGNIIGTYPIAFGIGLIYLFNGGRDSRQKIKQRQFDQAFRRFLGTKAGH